MSGVSHLSTERSGHTRGSSSAAPSSTAPRPPQPRCPAPVGLEDLGCPHPRGRSLACHPSEAGSGAHPCHRLRTAPDGTGGSWSWVNGSCVAPGGSGSGPALRGQGRWQFAWPLLGQMRKQGHCASPSGDGSEDRPRPPQRERSLCGGRGCYRDLSLGSL